MATSHYVIPKLMRATRDFLKAGADLADIPAASIIAGIQLDKINPPKVFCAVLNAELIEGAPFSGVLDATLLVQIQSDSDNSTEDQHHNRAIAIFDLLATDAVAGDHNTVSTLSSYQDDFTAFRVYPVAQRFGVEDPHWISELELRVTCCGSDIS